MALPSVIWDKSLPSLNPWTRILASKMRSKSQVQRKLAKYWQNKLNRRLYFPCLWISILEDLWSILTLIQELWHWCVCVCVCMCIISELWSVLSPWQCVPSRNQRRCVTHVSAIWNSDAGVGLLIFVTRFAMNIYVRGTRLKSIRKKLKILFLLFFARARARAGNKQSHYDLLRDRKSWIPTAFMDIRRFVITRPLYRRVMYISMPCININTELRRSAATFIVCVISIVIPVNCIELQFEWYHIWIGTRIAKFQYLAIWCK